MLICPPFSSCSHSLPASHPPPRSPLKKHPRQSTYPTIFPLPSNLSSSLASLPVLDSIPPTAQCVLLVSIPVLQARQEPSSLQASSSISSNLAAPPCPILSAAFLDRVLPAAAISRNRFLSQMPFVPTLGLQALETCQYFPFCILRTALSSQMRCSCT